MVALITSFYLKLMLPMKSFILRLRKIHDLLKLATLLIWKPFTFQMWPLPLPLNLLVSFGNQDKPTLKPQPAQYHKGLRNEPK